MQVEVRDSLTRRPAIIYADIETIWAEFIDKALSGLAKHGKQAVFLRLRQFE